MNGDDMSYKFHDVGVEIQHHLSRILSGIELKATVASVPALFTTYLGGDWYLAEAWFAFMMLDLVFGVAHGLKTSSFSRARLYGWVVKALTHAGTLLMIGVVTIMLKRLTGYPVPLLDLLVFVLALTEAASILATADKLGLPVHPLVKTLVVKLRRRAEAKLREIADGKDAEND
jgi:phage-related holin